MKGGFIVKVCIIGLGYIGFPTACVVTKAGYEVLGVDTNSDIIIKLKNGGLHIINEDGLADIAREAFNEGRLRVSDKPEPADVFIIAVPTPFRQNFYRQENSLAGNDVVAEKVAATSVKDRFRGNDLPYTADLSYVERATRDLATYLSKGNLVILESTVPPGTTVNLVQTVLEEETGLVCGHDFFLAHAPERVLPGNILHELIYNDRVIGGVDSESGERAVAFYKSFVKGDVVKTDATTAELVKLMENTFRDVNIALANEFALIAEKLGVDIFHAISLANRHPRVNILKPGPGVGGHCLAVDPYFIVQVVPETARLISLAREINSTMPYHVMRLFEGIATRCAQKGKPVKKVALLGASYKANVGDERESPAIKVAHLLSEKGYPVVIHDPYIEIYNSLSLDDVVRRADVLILLTDHDIYRAQLEPHKVFNLMRQPVVLDTRGFFGQEWDAMGFEMIRLGVGKRSC